MLSTCLPGVDNGKDEFFSSDEDVEFGVVDFGLAVFVESDVLLVVKCCSRFPEFVVEVNDPSSPPFLDFLA